MKAAVLALLLSLLAVGCSENEQQPNENQESRAARIDEMMAIFEMPKLVSLELKYGVDQEVVRNVMAFAGCRTSWDYYKEVMTATNGFPHKFHDELINGLRAIAVSNGVSENVIGAIYFDLQIYENANSD